MNWLGVDYGSKLAGTTAVCFLKDKHLHFKTSPKGKDADIWLQDQINHLQPDYLFIDAPLSLPGVYLFPETYTNYFYRDADITLGAMSPMFLGGLTARAMRFKANCPSISMIETYPGYFARLWELSELGYKKEIEHIPNVLTKLNQINALPLIEKSPNTWHEVDALIAWIAGQRFQSQSGKYWGNTIEGSIYC